MLENNAIFLIYIVINFFFKLSENFSFFFLNNLETGTNTNMYSIFYNISNIINIQFNL